MESFSVAPFECWNHIIGKKIPAICTTRDFLPSKFQFRKLLWNYSKWYEPYYSFFLITLLLLTVIIHQSEMHSNLDLFPVPVF